MQRSAFNQLCHWKNTFQRKPLIIRGARQVGKTWLMKEFGRREYEKCLYINFDNNTRMQHLFKTDLNVQRIVTGLELETGTEITPSTTLIIFDEVQEVPEALTSLKYFCENAPEYHIMAAGSMLGVALHPGTSFPVGKVEFMDLYPLSFSEFLRAVANPKLVQAYEAKDWDMITAFASTFTELLKNYTYVGGMPEAVASFLEQSSYKSVRQIQERILVAYEQDFSKHAPHDIVPRIRMLWNSIPSQLGKDNKKFIYGLVKEGARAREYEMAMIWLIDCGLIHKISRVSKPGMPLKAYEDLKAFKLFLLDTGLLGAMTSLDAKTLLDGNRLFVEFKGALIEQYVLQQLKAEGNMPIYYWSADRGEAEIDFIIQHETNIIPIEVKAENNLQAKSLKTYREKFSPALAIKTSLHEFHKDESTLHLPLFALHHLTEYISNEWPKLDSKS